ncbi:MAG: GNAT family N-acetyltransferase [Candidatus Amoebophilus sp. 36-38]|nr:MAG: GNAT family N-acetyltransferase [Candidatus Amoebophilus sp. 36-38]
MDIATIVTGFANANWSKSASMFEIYWQQQQAGSMQVWVAHLNQQFAGYIILNWKSDYKPFYSQGIPEIMDLNILPSFRKQGVGSKLLDTAEAMVAIKTNQVGLGIKLYAEYGPVQRLYVRRGYIPDGRGVTYHYQHIAPGSNVSLDDDLVLWFVKRLS